MAQNSGPGWTGDGPLGWFMRLDFRKAIWLAPVVWTIHECEEWKIDAFESRRFVRSLYEASALDPAKVLPGDHLNLWISLAIVAAYGFIWTALTAWPKNPKFAAFLTLPFFFYLPLGNVFQHLYWVAYFKMYTPGAVTAVLLVAPVIIGLTIKAVHSRLIPRWYAAMLCLLVIPTAVSTILSGNHLCITPMCTATTFFHAVRGS